MEMMLPYHVNLPTLHDLLQEWQGDTTWRGTHETIVVKAHIEN
jgi:hypothetical protein